MAGRVELPTTIDRRREAWTAFPGLSPKHHYLDLPANRPDMSDPVWAWKPSITEARMCPNLLYNGCTGMFLLKLLFPVRKIMSQGRLWYICIVRSNTSVSGDAITTSACLSIEAFRSSVFSFAWQATSVFSQCIPGNCRIEAFRQPC